MLCGIFLPETSINIFTHLCQRAAEMEGRKVASFYKVCNLATLKIKVQGMPQLTSPVLIYIFTY